MKQVGCARLVNVLCRLHQLVQLPDLLFRELQTKRTQSISASASSYGVLGGCRRGAHLLVHLEIHLLALDASCQTIFGGVVLEQLEVHLPLLEETDDMERVVGLLVPVELCQAESKWRRGAGQLGEAECGSRGKGPNRLGRRRLPDSCTPAAASDELEESSDRA